MAENNIIIKITSEADVTTADVALEELIEQSDRVGEQIEEARKQFRKAMGDIVKSAEDGTLSMEDMNKEVEELTRDYVKQRQELAKQRKENENSIKSIKTAVNAYNAMEGASGKMVQRLRAMREALQEMEDAGEFGSEAFIELSIAAGKLEDQIGDTQQRIRILASDTKELDAIMGLGDGLAGSFYIATSAAELFGDDLEGLQKAFYKVQAAMAIVSGIQQTYNALQKDGAFRVVFRTAVERIANKTKNESTVALTRNTKAWIKNGVAETGATIKTIAHTAAVKVATIAQAAWNAVIYANPIMLLVAGVAAAGAAIYGLTKYFGENAKASRAAAKASAQYDRQNKITSFNMQIYAHEHEKAIREIDKEEADAILSAKQRNATEQEIAEIELEYLKRRQTETQKYSEKAIKQNNIELKVANEQAQAREKVLKTQTVGTKKYYEALEKSQEANRIMNDVWIAGNNILKERDDINRAVEEKELEIANIKKGKSAAASEATVQAMKNELTAMSQLLKTEDDYLEELKLSKKIAEEEAKVRINSLDRKVLGEKAYQAQVEAIRLELAAMLKQIDEQEVQRQVENAKRLTDIEIAEAEARKNALTGAESQDEQLATLDRYYAARKKQLEENAEMEKQAVQRSTDTEEVKEAKIKQINANLQTDLTALNKEGAEERINIETQYLGDLEREVSKTEDAVSRAQIGGKLGALQAHLDAQLNLYQAQQSKVEQQYAAGLITYQDYKQQEFEISKAITDAEVQYQQDKMQAIADGFEFALNQIQQVSDLAFEAINQNIQAEMDALDEQYTTDWEEAQKSADKKYITEKEYEKKKAALEMKQAKYAKAQAIINAGINTALAIVTTLAQLGATPWGIAASVIAGAMGAAQIGVIASKPLAQYEKGRKGGKGEYALVGEKGAEIMYVPQGASIIPHNKIADQAAWADYGVPKLAIPPLPTTDLETTKYISTTTDNRLTIDYDKLGEAVARNMPKPQAVTVNVDRSGIRVIDAYGSHEHLNKKYTGTWN